LATYYKRKSKYGGSEASEFRPLEAENARLKRLYADKAMETEALRDLIKNGNNPGHRFPFRSIFASCCFTLMPG
jgi:hypothetical protein